MNDRSDYFGFGFTTLICKRCTCTKICSTKNRYSSENFTWTWCASLIYTLYIITIGIHKIDFKVILPCYIWNCSPQRVSWRLLSSQDFCTQSLLSSFYYWLCRWDKQTYRLFSNLAWQSRNTNGYQKHQFSKFPDFFLIKIKFPWPNECKISRVLAFPYSSTFLSFTRVTSFRQKKHNVNSDSNGCT